MAFVATSTSNLMAQNVAVHAPVNQLNDQVNSLQIMPQNIANIGSGQVIMLQPVTIMTQDSSGRLMRQTQYQVVKQNNLTTNNFTIQPQQLAFLSNVSLANTQVAPAASQITNNFVTINGSCLFQLNNSQLQTVSSCQSKFGNTATAVKSTNGAIVPSIQTLDNSLKQIMPRSSPNQRTSQQHQQETPNEEVITLESPVFMCEECDQQFERWGRYQRHLKTHEEESLFRCEKCPLTFTVQYNLTLHMAVHKTESLECPECHKKFSRLASLKSHILLHVKEEIFSCPICLEEFANQTQLDRHHRKKHKFANLQNTSNVAGTESSTGVTTSLQLTSANNMKKEVENLMTSSTLTTAGNVLAVLTTNVSERTSTSSSDKPLICGQCKMSFDKVAALKEHMKMHRLKQSQNHRKYKRLVDRSRFAHQCGYCNKNFQKPSQLERHLRIHTGERPYKCDSCDKAFNQKGALIIHLSRHTGNRPFNCSDCPSSFSQRGNLRAHVQRVHPTVKEGSSFKCFHCSCIFKKLSSLNAHLTRFHGDPKLQTDVTLNLIDPQTGFLKSVLNSNDVSLDDDVNNGGNDDEVGGDDKNCGEKLDRSSSGQGQLSDISLSLSMYSNLNRSNLTDNDNTERSINDISNIEGNNNNDDTNTNDDYSSGVAGLETGSDSKGELMAMIMQDAATGAVAKHFIRKVNGVRWHQCNYCSKEFKKPSDLIRHVRVHTRERPYSCPQCYRSFSVKSTLTSHIRTHSGVREFKCHICSKWFSSSSSLHTHSRLHTGVRPFKCRKCDRSFRTSGHRASHERSFHSQDPFQFKRGAASHSQNASQTDDVLKLGGADKGKPSPMLQVVLQEPITITEQGPVQTDLTRYVTEDVGVSNRPYVCQDCNHAFKKSSHLKQHIRSHTGEKPYTCKICHKGYVSGGVLKAHMKTHQGSKDHKCPYCHHAFTTVGSMRRHMTTHSDKRDFICPYCQKAFKTRVNCKKHIKTHRTEVAQQTITFNQPHQQQQLQGLDNNKFTNHDAELAGISDLTDTEGEMGQISLIEVSSDFVKTLQEVVNAGQNGSDLILQHIPAMQDGETHQLLHHQIVNNKDSNTINQQQMQRSGEDILHLNTLLAENVNSDEQEQHRYVTLQPIQQQQQLLQHKVGNEYLTVQNQYPILIQDGKELLVSIPGDGNQAWATMMLSHEGEGQAGDVREETGERVVGEVAYQCPLCEELCPDVDALRQHVVSHGETVIRNNDNQHFMTQMEQQQQQQQPAEQHEVAFPCEICSIVFHSNRSLRQHMSVHSSAAITPATSVVSGSTVPTSQMPQFFCDVCLLTFRNATRKVKHMETYHNKKQSALPDPGKDAVGSEIAEDGSQHDGSVASAAPASDEDYFDEEGDEPLGDSLSEEDKLSLSLSKHILFEVKQESKRMFESQNSRMRNTKATKQHSKNQHVNVNSKRSRGDGQSLNRCSSCDKTFKKPSDLVRHVRIHTGEKPYACGQCNRRFTVKSTLDNHLNTHNPGEKKFHCHMCNSPFSTKGSLKVHMRLHTGSRPFKCLYCDQRFRTSGHRKSHMSHHLQLMVTSPSKTATASTAANAVTASSASAINSSLPTTVQHQKKTLASEKAVSIIDCTKTEVVASDDQIASEEQSEVFDLASTTAVGDNSLYDGTNVNAQAPLNLDFNISITNAMGHSEVLDGEAAMQLLQLFGFDPSVVLRKREDGETEQQLRKQQTQQPQTQFILQQQQTITLQEQPGFSKDFLGSADSEFTAITVTPPEGKSVSQTADSAPGVSRTRVKDSVVASLKKKALLSKSKKGKSDNKHSKSILKAKQEALKGKDNQSKENTTEGNDHVKKSSLGDQQQQSEQQYVLQTLDDIFRNQQQLHKNHGCSDGSGDNVFGSEEVAAPAEGENSSIAGLLSSGVDPSFFDQGYLILQPDLSMSETFMNSSDNFLSTGGVGSYSDSMTMSTGSNLQPVEALFNSDQKNFFQTTTKPLGATSNISAAVGLFQPVIGFSLPLAVSLLPTTSSATTSGSGQSQAKVPSRRCSDCGKAFYKPSQLIRHRRIHTGERPFECTECGKQFNQKNALKIHSFNHKGVKPYPCSICGQQFSQKGNLKAHIRRIHKNVKQDQASAV